MKTRSPRFAFTLIELLVVIAIIGLLATVVMAAVNASRVKSRDARRKADFKAIQVALELYYDDKGRYPTALAGNSCNPASGLTDYAVSNGTCGGQWLTADPDFYQYIKNVPVDPRNIGVYVGNVAGEHNVYNYMSWSADNYELITRLESTDDPDTCTRRGWLAHAVALPWCAPWAGHLGRSGLIYSAH